MCNNRSLESLELNWVDFEGDSKGSPAHLLKLRSLTFNFLPKKLSSTIHIPAFQRLSSLRISGGDDNIYTLYAAGDDITLTTGLYLNNLAETWEELTGSAKPIIHHIRLYDGPMNINHDDCLDDISGVALLMIDAQTLEVGYNYLEGWYQNFWEDLKQLGPQLKTIRFEVSEDMEPCLGAHDFIWEAIENLVKYRFDQGRPFSAVERLVVSESDRKNRMQAFVWRCFYGFCELGQYIQPVQV